MRRWASPDLIFAAGGGIMAHPDGSGGRLRRLREAWEAALAGIAAGRATRGTTRALAKALEAYACMSAPCPTGRWSRFYGDDFTGSTAVMEVLTFAGLPTVLFLDVPTPERLARFAGYRGDRHRRRGAVAKPGLDGPAPAAGVPRAGAAAGADLPLQGLLDA